MFATVRLHRLLPVAAALALAACAQTSQMVDTPMKAMKGTPTLYERLGGQPAIDAVVDDFVANVAADKRINKFFANSNIPRLKRLLGEQICAGTGGPCTYTGRDMKTTHAGMGVTEKHFNALVEDLVMSLDKHKVPQKEQQELLGVLGPMKPDIVTR
ncbi:MAG TPA: group 1 truncated hemoglobin [Candidatus Competibacter sp.]|nr:hemin transporter [Candidatus Competibacteraceae bacterium]HRC72053.1 group 1 truncated hemoglobin [Candidatus Competibacter sp.]